jgi:hypothetical protein
MGWQAGTPLGLLIGLFFGFAMAASTSVLRRRFQTVRPDFSDEQLLFEGPANHFSGLEAAGGWLYLTTRRLLFRSHRLNFQPHETNLPLEDIVKASPTLTAGLIPNGLLVNTISGRRERFVVDNRKRWSDAISKAKQNT